MMAISACPIINPIIKLPVIFTIDVAIGILLLNKRWHIFVIRALSTAPIPPPNITSKIVIKKIYLYFDTEGNNLVFLEYNSSHHI